MPAWDEADVDTKTQSNFPVVMNAKLEHETIPVVHCHILRRNIRPHWQTSDATSPLYLTCDKMKGQRECVPSVYSLVWLSMLALIQFSLSES